MRRGQREYGRAQGTGKEAPMRTIATLLTVFLSLTPALAHERPDKVECTAIKEKIRHIQSKMRAGYTRAQGERMEEQLRKLRLARSKKCR